MYYVKETGLILFELTEKVGLHHSPAPCYTSSEHLLTLNLQIEYQDNNSLTFSSIDLFLCIVPLPDKLEVLELFSSYLYFSMLNNYKGSIEFTVFLIKKKLNPVPTRPRLG